MLWAQFLVGQRGRWVVLAALSVPFWGSLGANLVGSAAQGMSQTPELPALVFEQYQVDFGRVSPKEKEIARFAFTNNGTEPVRITKLTPSCGCLQPRIEKMTYEPGESGDFYLCVQTANQDPGPKKYRVKVQYEDPQPREREVLFKVTLPENQVLIRPKALLIYQPGEEPTEEEIVVTDFRRGPLELLGVTCASEYVTAEILPSEQKSASREHRIKITVRGPVPPGRHSAVLEINTTDKAYHELRVPIWLDGPQENIVQTSATDRHDHSDHEHAGHSHPHSHPHSDGVSHAYESGRNYGPKRMR